MNKDTRQKNAKLVRTLVLVAVGMFGFGYALVPLYDVMCEVVFKKEKPGLPVAAEEVSYQIDKNREITVEFMTTVNESAPMVVPSRNKQTENSSG